MHYTHLALGEYQGLWGSPLAAITIDYAGNNGAALVELWRKLTGLEWLFPQFFFFLHFSLTPPRFSFNLFEVATGQNEITIQNKITSFPGVSSALILYLPRYVHSQCCIALGK